MPKPKSEESRKEFMERCMVDPESVNTFPDASKRYAVCNSIWTTDRMTSMSKFLDSMAAEKISFDYDDTLNTDKGIELAKRYIQQGADVYIISARQEKDGILNKAKELGIPESRIYATGSNKAKVEKIKELGISKHYDNNQDVINELGVIGIKLAESYTDYPKQATENAKIALRYAEENGWGDCGTPVGKQRANQLANGEPISEDTISRMASFERHRQNSDKELGDGCGRLMWLAWGGDEGIEWAQRKLEQIRNEKAN